MRNALRLMSILAIASAAGAAHALGTPDGYALEDTAQDSLEYAKTDESTPWVDPDSGAEGTFTPVATHEGPEGQVCREYSVEAIIDGREEIVYGTACRRPDGSWVEANAEYRESDPPAATSEVYSGTDWRWIIPNIVISGGYCSSSFCVGGQLGSYYPSWYYPWGVSFSYWDYGRRGYYYPYYGSYRSHYRHSGHDRNQHRSHSRHAGHYQSQQRSHYRGERRNHYGSKHKNERRGRHSERARSRDRRSDRDRSTDTRSRNRRSRDERSASSRSENRRSGGERRASDRSGKSRSKSVRVASNRSGNSRASNRSGKSRSKSVRVASNRSGGDRSRGRQSSAARSGGGRSGGKRGGRSSDRH